MHRKSFVRTAAAGGSDTRAKRVSSNGSSSHCSACILIAAMIATGGFLVDTSLTRTHTPNHLLNRSVTLSFPLIDEHNPASGTVSQNCYGPRAISRWLRCEPHLNTKTRVSTHTVKTRLVTSEAAKEAI
jgi:hypothetical protein